MDKLAPNTAVATSAVTATTVPNSAVTTGTEVRPLPRSSARLAPTTTLGGAPALAKAVTAIEARPAAKSACGWSMRKRVARQAG